MFLNPTRRFNGALNHHFYGVELRELAPAAVPFATHPSKIVVLISTNTIICRVGHKNKLFRRFFILSCWKLMNFDSCTKNLHNNRNFFVHVNRSAYSRVSSTLHFQGACLQDVELLSFRSFYFYLLIYFSKLLQLQKNHLKTLVISKGDWPINQSEELITILPNLFSMSVWVRKLSLIALIRVYFSIFNFFFLITI